MVIQLIKKKKLLYIHIINNNNNDQVFECTRLAQISGDECVYNVWCEFFFLSISILKTNTIFEKITILYNPECRPSRTTERELIIWMDLYNIFMWVVHNIISELLLKFDYHENNTSNTILITLFNEIGNLTFR